MRTRNFVLLAIVAATGAAVAGRWVFDSRSDNSASKPAQLLVVEAGYETFGEVWETNDFHWSFPVVNRGDRPVVVENVTGSCTCLAISPQQFTLRPGEKQTLAVRIDFTAKPPKDGLAGFVLYYQASDPSGQRKDEGQWDISGRVKQLLRLDTVVDFGRHSVLDQLLPPLNVKAKFGTPVESVRVVSGDLRIRVSVDHAWRSDRCELIVCVADNLPVGTIETVVVLKVTLNLGDEREVRIPVTARFVPDVEASPPAFPGGGRAIGEWFEFDAVVSSISGKPFSVVSVKAVGNGLSVTARDGRYRVRQDCVATGEQSGWVEFEVEGGDGRYQVRVPVDYTGLPR